MDYNKKLFGGSVKKKTIPSSPSSSANKNRKSIINFGPKAVGVSVEYVDSNGGYNSGNNSQTEDTEEEPVSSVSSLASISNTETPIEPEKAKAIYDYNARADNELSIKKGQTIHILAKLESGWWRGELDGKKGHFPGSYVEILQPQASAQVVNESFYATALYDYEGKESNQLSFKKEEKIKIIKRHPSGWWKGELNGKSGYLPGYSVKPDDSVEGIAAAANSIQNVSVNPAPSDIPVKPNVNPVPSELTVPLEVPIKPEALKIDSQKQQPNIVISSAPPELPVKPEGLKIDLQKQQPSGKQPEIVVEAPTTKQEVPTTKQETPIKQEGIKQQLLEPPKEEASKTVATPSIKNEVKIEPKLEKSTSSPGIQGKISEKLDKKPELLATTTITIGTNSTTNSASVSPRPISIEDIKAETLVKPEQVKRLTKKEQKKLEAEQKELQKHESFISPRAPNEVILARCILDYTAKETTELTLKKGDIVILGKEYSILEKNNFWFGTKDNVQGTFPSVNIQEIRGVATFKYDFTGSAGKEFEIIAKKGDKIVIFEKYRSGWWLGDLNGKVGFFPSRYVLEDLNATFVESQLVGHNFKSKFPPPRPEKPDLSVPKLQPLQKSKSFALPFRRKDKEENYEDVSLPSFNPVPPSPRSDGRANSTNERRGSIFKQNKRDALFDEMAADISDLKLKLENETNARKQLEAELEKLKEIVAKLRTN